MCKVVEDYAKEYADEKVLDANKATIKTMFEQDYTIDSVLALFKSIPKEIVADIYKEVTGKAIVL